jgi:hypothetical protein
MLRKGRSGGSRFEASTDKNKILSKKNFTKKKKRLNYFKVFTKVYFKINHHQKTKLALLVYIRSIKEGNSLCGLVLLSSVFRNVLLFQK